MTIIQADIDAALKHLGWDDYDDFCAWALSNNEMNRFDDLAQAFAAHREAAEARVTGEIVAWLRRDDFIATADAIEHGDYKESQ